MEEEGVRIKNIVEVGKERGYFWTMELKLEGGEILECLLRLFYRSKVGSCFRLGTRGIE